MSSRVALVTGSSPGIGAAVARRLAAEGCSVVVNSRSSVEAGRAVADEIGGSYLQADGRRPRRRAPPVVDQVLNVHGRLDVLVNNAGTTEVIPHADLAAATPEIWRRLYEVLAGALPTRPRPACAALGGAAGGYVGGKAYDAATWAAGKVGGYFRRRFF